MALTTDGLALPLSAPYRPVCGVVVVAAVAGITFDAAWGLLAGMHRPGWTGMTHEETRTKALRHLGVEVVRCLISGRSTLNTLAKRLDPDRRYIVRTHRHVQLVHQGHILDQGGWRPITPKDWACRKYVTSVLRVEE
jgi:hypothetical protein